MKVKANANWGLLLDGATMKPRKLGEEWEVTEERGNYLLSKGVVDLVPDAEKMEEVANLIEEVEIAKPKKRGRPKKS